MPLSSRHEVTVEWGDCDPAGIVYYPSYFRWFDQATYRLFLAAGLRRDDITSGQWKEGTPLVHAECSFKRASQTGEKLVVESHVAKFGRSSFTINHVFRDCFGRNRRRGNGDPHLGAQRRRCALAEIDSNSRGREEAARRLSSLGMSASAATNDVRPMPPPSRYPPPSRPP